MRRKACFLLPFVLGGCATGAPQARHVNFAEQAGSTHLAVLSIQPWDQAKATLQPTFSMSESDALVAAIPNTAQTEERMLDIIGAMVKLATPTVSTSLVTETQNTSGQTPVSTSDNKTTRSSGDVSSMAAASLPTLTASSLPGAPSSWSQTLSSDAMLQYLAATAIKQEVALLNSYITNAAIPRDADGKLGKAYVVRLQYSAMPSGRNLPYDIYTNISFLPELSGVAVPEPADAKTGAAPAVPAATCAKGQPGTISIVPMLVTDDLEGILASRTSDTARQFSLTLLAMLHGVGIGGDVQRTTERLDHAIGKDLNSLFTVARLSEDTIRVRLGAQAAPQSVGYAMTPQTHNISLLVVYHPCKGTGTTTPTDAVYAPVIAVARSEYHEANSGGELPHLDITAPYRTKDWLKLSHTYGLKDGMYLPLAGYAMEGRFQEFRNYLLTDTNSNIRAFATSQDGSLNVQMADYHAMGIYSFFNAKQSANQFSTAPFKLLIDGPAPTQPDVTQTLLIPYGKSPATVHLSLGKNLSGAALEARLTIPAEGSTPAIVIPASAIKIDDDTSLDVTFPALASYLAKPSGNAAVPSLPKGTAISLSTAGGASGAQAMAPYSSLKLIAAADPAAASPAFTLVGKTTSLTLQNDGTALMDVQVTQPNPVAGTTPKLYLATDGGMIKDVTNLAGSAVALSAKGYTVSAAGYIRLTLANVALGNKLSVRLIDDKAATQGATVDTWIVGKAVAQDSTK